MVEKWCRIFWFWCGNGVEIRKDGIEICGFEMVKHFCNTTTEQISLLRIPFFKWRHISI